MNFNEALINALKELEKNGKIPSTIMSKLEKLSMKVDASSRSKHSSSQKNPHRTRVNQLNDTTISSVADNDILAYDSTSEKWLNQSASEAGVSASSHTHVEADITDLGTYIENVVEDTTPSLGGDLNAGGYNIANIGFVGLGVPGSGTISSGSVTATKTLFVVAGEGATTDDLDTISGTSSGDMVIIFKDTGAYTLTAKDGTGNLQLAGDFAMNSVADVLVLINRGGTLFEISRSNNA